MRGRETHGGGKGCERAVGEESRVSTGSALYTKNTRSEPLIRRSTAVKSWPIWANMGFQLVFGDLDF
jgi:hypothetical protein